MSFKGLSTRHAYTNNFTKNLNVIYFRYSIDYNLYHIVCNIILHIILAFSICGYKYTYIIRRYINKIFSWKILIIVIFNIFSGGILLFYAVFYSSLACMFAICMKVLLSTLNDHTPHFTLTSSIIGTNPGTLTQLFCSSR